MRYAVVLYENTGSADAMRTTGRDWYNERKWQFVWLQLLRIGNSFSLFAYPLSFAGRLQDDQGLAYIKDDHGLASRLYMKP